MESDKQLVEAAIAGDTDAFGALVQKYSNALYSVAYGVLGDFHLAKDIAQETFLRAYLRLPTLKNKSKVGSWLYSVAYRLSIDWQRKRKNVVSMEKISRAPASNDTEAEAIDLNSSEEIWRILNTLDELNRIPIILYYISEWSMREIAEFLGITLRAVESRLQRAKKNLRTEFASYLGDSISSYRLSADFKQEVMLQIPALIGIPCVYISVNDEKKSENWYKHNLGLDFDRTPNAGSLNIGFIVEQDVVPVPYPLFAFSTPSLAKARLTLASLGIELQETTENSNSFTFQDPDGNVLCMMQI
ncbi:sigma-70 family RNA polymerase sigma factor [Paenibacillus psychroresistens]|uniref:Sigma-70 family RNA polymerase sigma factor n=1 Tax=Paenibacillus psychroresistens TaxID=1778678 RepID=A0A6B8RP03_9BACL|nr:sigma-70 family RNA polymerase sigma factor [Paenibacillus psychroresistens]QGQ98070.1 sigma-70 family RNA polymerase sigma factor [Paenibacillus psychroresistens]